MRDGRYGCDKCVEECVYAGLVKGLSQGFQEVERVYKLVNGTKADAVRADALRLSVHDAPDGTRDGICPVSFFFFTFPLAQK
jgi:hypothetical protein